ncbi:MULTISPECIES: 2'-5' RNA ligase family protein [unclassified Rothia (in: high G+C Gram-positive bacteria)]|uniref:2'-5' RNA ligase family protein n=1 Tax=unclassified Rothia (in: high G+C Gram-positive bacteria) TaxID=2689056 RepID=UPI00195B126B|nr:2'-5' RNA ligase family protein [Rothia sp. ZJ932]MBM7051471.1 2'-5' RNA ligase family protein [Rothia sp. ZJ1223]QRZ61259.1 2'-5' RNA ligase family protein [Rothia sp. ZJ932]
MSLVARVPDELAARIERWRVAQPEILNPGSVHITVMVAPETVPASQTLAALQKALMGRRRVFVGLGEPASFAPVTTVSYLPLIEGGAELIGLNRVAERAVESSASPFEYRPHLTLAQHVPHEVIDRSLRDFKCLPDALKRFEIQRLCVYRYEKEEWHWVGTIELT